MTAIPTPHSEQLLHVMEQAWRRGFYRDHWRLQSFDQVVSVIKDNAWDQIPIMRKQHLRDYWNDIMDFTDAVDVVSSSGTTGRPVDVPVHRSDEELRIGCVRRALTELGVRSGSRVLLLLSLNDLFTLGPLTWEATKAIGATGLRVSAPRLERIAQVVEFLQLALGSPTGRHGTSTTSLPAPTRRRFAASVFP